MSSFRPEFHGCKYYMFRTAKKATLELYNDNEVQDEAEPDEKE
jgi:hypothetical protein